MAEETPKKRRPRNPSKELAEKLGAPPEEEEAEAAVGAIDGTQGQDRESYADGQDRESHAAAEEDGDRVELRVAERVEPVRAFGPPSAPSVLQLLVEVLGELPSIAKSGTAPEGMGGYQFRKIDDILDAIKPLLAEKGVLPVPNTLERIGEERHTRGGSALYVVHLKVRYRFYGAPRGDYIDAVVWGEGMDNFDKATNKAMTTAFKNALQQVFAVASGEPDSESGSFEETTGTRRPGQGRPTAPIDPDKPSKAARELLGGLGWRDPDEAHKLHMAMAERIRKLGEADEGDKALIADFRTEAKLPWPMGPDDWQRLDEFIETLEGPGPDDDEGNAEDVPSEEEPP